MSVRRLAWLGGTLAVAACVERMTAPGKCPEFCPSGQITVVDTILRTSISKDSAFRGYVPPHHAPVLLAADLPGQVDSRVVFRLAALGVRLPIKTNDTTTGAILGADSARLQLYITRRDTAARNLTLRLYRLPLTLDSVTAFADLAGPFTDSVLHTVHVDSLLAKPGRIDPATGDSIVVDTTNDRLQLLLKLDTVQARYVVADSGKVAYGIRVSADSLASIALGKGDLGSLLTWYVTADSLGTPAKPPVPPRRAASFESFVFEPPLPPLDSTLAVGGVPSARSILRVGLPRAICDSSQIVRATLILVPDSTAPPRGAPADSFVIEAHAVLADFGAKSPIAVDRARTDTALIRIGATDTVRIEVTNLLQFWASDTLAPAVIVLRAQQEAGGFAEIRFHSSANSAFRPALRVTYAPRFPFGKP